MSRFKEFPSEKRKKKGNVGNCHIIGPTSKILPRGKSTQICNMTSTSPSKLTAREQLEQQEAEEQSLQSQVSSFYNSISSSQPKELTTDRGSYNRLPGTYNPNETQFIRSNNKLIQYKTICIKSNDRTDNNRDVTIDRINRTDNIDINHRYTSDNDDDDGDDDDDDAEEDDEDDDEDEDDDDNESNSNESDFSNLSGLSDLSGQEWKPITKSITWVQRQINSGINPRDILSQFLSNGTTISENLNDMSLWRILTTMLAEPPRRQKLRHINTINDVVRLLKESKNIIVLTGAGVSVSCGIPDFRSSDGIYSRLAKDFPDLPDPQAMFDINYFSRDPRPFYKFAREIYPGQFTPSPCHRFIKLLEKKDKLLRNYTQNIDTLEQVAGIQNVIECHGSFATASCTRCKYKTTADAIRDDIFTQKIPLCPKCHPNNISRENIEQRQDRGPEDQQSSSFSELVQSGIMKPDIVFFGEGLPDAFHSAMASDKDKCDLLIVIGSSLKVRPVALIPSSIPAYVPQILINREQLNHLEFDVELLGDSDIIINQLCHILGDDWTEICWQSTLTESKYLKMSPTAGCSNVNVSAIDTDSQSTKSAITTNSSSCGIFCDSGFESSSSLYATSGTMSTSSTTSSATGQTMSTLSTTSSSIDNITNETERLDTIIAESTTQKQQHFIKTEKNLNNVRHFSVDSSKDSGICESSNSNMPLSSIGCKGSNLDGGSDIDCGQDDDETTIGNIDDPETDDNNDIDDYQVVNRKISRSSPSTSYLSINKPVSVADKLPENAYYYNSSTCSYVFPGAQVYWTSSDSEYEDEVDEDDDGEDSEYKRLHFLRTNNRSEETISGVGGGPSSTASTSSTIVDVDNNHHHHHHHHHRTSDSDDSPPVKRRKDTISSSTLDG